MHQHHDNRLKALGQRRQSTASDIPRLVGEPLATTSKRGPAPKLQQQMDRIAKLPKSQQRFVMQVIESVLAQAQAGR